jgi:citrate lyase subunit beta/citryl-CoA lyase
MKEQITISGTQGKAAKSDCFISFQQTVSGGNIINLKSKVEANFGNSIRNLALDILDFFEIENSILKIEDQGALDFVLAARIEAAIKKQINSEKEYLLAQRKENQIPTSKEKNRFSRLYLPGNSPKLMINAGLHNPDGLILDLEDAVSPDKKYEARFLVRNALRSVNFYGAERMIRINQGNLAEEDLKLVIPQKPNLVLIPKCESADNIIKINKLIDKYKADNQPIWIMPIIESALGVEMAFEIAKAADNIVALAIGLEDYTADIGAPRTDNATESFYARTRLVNACKAAGIQAIDSVFSNVSDMEALAENVKVSKSLGFNGMGCIHPRQIKVIHDNFAPNEKEIEKACKIVNAFLIAEEKGLGVVALGSKMIDAPVVKRAQKVVDLALNLKLIQDNWRDSFIQKKY